VPPLTLHPDRFLPVDPTTRDLARRIHAVTASRPIVSPHGHVDAALFVRDAPFADPTALLITPDHYVTRLLHADGVGLDTLGVGGEPLDEARSRRAFTELCARWDLLAGTAVRSWLEAEFVDLFGVDRIPSAANAEAIYDTIAEALASEAFRPRALWDRFGLSVLATTDDPCSDLAAHRMLAADPTWSGRVVPTFRPDAYLEPARPDWTERVAALGAAADVDTGSYPGYLAALEARRRFFVANGATAADHSHVDVRSEPLSAADAARIYSSALAGEATRAETVAFRRHMLAEMARMSCEDGLVMMLHPGVVRNHHTPTLDRFGPDTGHDLPRRIDFVEPLRPLLERHGTHPGFHLVLFTLDETAWSRELAPLAGFYPSVYVGVPWWFLDAPDALGRFWSAVVDQVGFGRTSGFIDDTRAFLSIPGRHDLSRRIEAGVLARLVTAHRIGEDEALAIAAGLVGDQPRKVFKL
jgi:glucuronate isomerase